MLVSFLSQGLEVNDATHTDMGKKFLNQALISHLGLYEKSAISSLELRKLIFEVY